MNLETLVIISIIASVSSPIIIFFLQFYFMKRMQREITQATDDAKVQLMEIINDPKTYDTIISGLTVATKKMLIAETDKVIENMEHMLNQVVPALLGELRHSVNSLYGNGVKAINLEATGLADDLIGVTFGKGHSRANAAKQLVKKGIAHLKQKQVQKKLEKEGTENGNRKNS